MTITIKIGSNVLTKSDGMLHVERMGNLVKEIADLHAQGHKVILVTSGAVAAGRSMAKNYQALDPVSQRQLLSSIGQVKLIDTYKKLFDNFGISIGQILVTKQDFRTREHYLNMRNCISTLWDSGVIPVVNENDTVSVTALMFTDNDELSGLIARMTQSQMLIILSNIDGIYTGDPANPESRLVSIVKPGKDLSDYIQSKKSSAGRGGMQSKTNIAAQTAAAGISVIIANGKRDDILIKLMNDRDNTPCTEFLC